MSRLFDEFQKKNTVPKVSKISSKSAPQDIVIVIPLKSNADQRAELDDNFVKAIEYEYAVKYLEIMGVSPTPKMIAMLLKNHPLSSCELSSGWSKTGWLASWCYINPNKKSKKVNLERKRTELGLRQGGSQANLSKAHSTIQLDKGILQPLQINMDKYKLDPSKREDTERSAESKKKELNMDPQYWKQKFLYPFLVKEDLEGGKVKKLNKSKFLQMQNVKRKKKSKYVV